MQRSNLPDQGRLLARLQRVLTACHKGLNHDLPNELLALQGLLQLVNLEESENPRPSGQESVHRMMAGVVQRTRALAKTLADLSRLGSDELPPAEVLALPELAEEARVTLVPPPLCLCQWQSPQVLAPRALVLQALMVVYRLLAETLDGSPARLAIAANACEYGVELNIGVWSDPGMAHSNTSPAPSAASLPKTWLDRLECVLLQELADCWDGTVHWQAPDGAKAVKMTLPAPR